MYDASPLRDSDKAWDSLQPILSYKSRNALTRAARGSDGRVVVLKVLAIGEEGKAHLEILDMLARGPYSLITANHTLPLLELIVLDDITFGVFPKVGYSCSEMYGGWAKSSVRDVLEMIIQCLEDVFKDNFVIQWLPETLRAERELTASRPRVYMIGFDLAVSFPEDSPPEEHSTIPAVDKVLESLTDPDPATRPTAYEAMTALLKAVSEVPPVSLLIEPHLEPRRLEPEPGPGPATP
uniref:N/A n=1 Tax=Ganoderma boninense TaxID=34458 RepID=A0A5K1K7Z2_9APHY|nr:N/A [Ganoderma boninense]